MADTHVSYSNKEQITDVEFICWNCESSFKLIETIGKDKHLKAVLTGHEEESFS